MKKVLSVILCVALAVTILAGCGGDDSSRNSSGAASVTVVNEATWAFEEIYISPSDADSWGYDKGALDIGDSYDVLLDAADDGYYDMEATDEAGDYWTFMELPLEDGCTIYIWEDETDIVVDIEYADGDGTSVEGSLTINSGDAEEEPAEEAAAPPAPGFYNVTPEIMEEQSRINNHSRIAIHGEWRYGPIYGEQGIYFVREKGADGSGGIVLDDRGIARDIAILDDATMFYTLDNADDVEEGLYVSGTDGSNRTLLVAGDVSRIQLFGGKLYYTGAANGHILQCYDPATGETTTVLDKEIYYPYVYGDKIMYQLQEGAGDTQTSSIHVCDMDGSNEARITTTWSHYPVYDGEYLYYADGNDNNAICRILPDGTGGQKLSSINAQGLIVTADAVYFANKDDGKIYRMNKDGTDARIFAPDSYTTSSPILYGGAIYYIQRNADNTGNGGYYYVNMADGSIYAAMATPDPNPKPTATPKPGGSSSQGDAYIPPDYYYYDGWGDDEIDGYGDDFYYYDEGWGDDLYY
ncbi:DUF5050 domain-containing protein [Christensenellaceae bacterium OttesenSCG-928-K19]|nr:DUF5050 domain-containing protein [Christensenellaceae bacterium OttesenSCG-928-K19]